MPADASATGRTVNAVLGGRLRLEQPDRGHRVGHDAILLAAACPARPQERVVDLGAGVGAAGLALAVRVAGADVTLLEVDVGLAALAAANVRRNGLDARVTVLDVAAPARSFAAVGLGPDSVARVLMNPPFNDPVRQRASPDRRLAHAGSGDMLAVWVRTAARLLRPRGTLTLIWRADGLAAVLRTLNSAFGAVAVLPVYGKPGQPAIRVLVRATKSSGAPLALLPGFLLNDGAGRPTSEAETVLRAGRPLPLGEA